jgi:hypothetical protein
MRRGVYKAIFLIAVLLTVQGCVYFNECGVSNRLYRDCKEYYDSEGNYHKECPKNIVNYSDFED